jgi:hypothetical protein
VTPAIHWLEVALRGQDGQRGESRSPFELLIELVLLSFKVFQWC